MNKDRKLDFKTKYKLKKPCLDCEKERAYYRINEFCFAHQWENPWQLKNDEKEAMNYWRSQLFIFGVGFLVMSLPLIIVIGGLLKGKYIFLIALVTWFLLMVCLSWDLLQIKKEVTKELQAIKKKQKQWVKINK